MNYHLRFLHLEDSHFGAKLIWEKIEEEWPECRIDRVETEQDFRKALEQGGLDLILADYSLPGFDGLEALRIARKTVPEIPFIFVSGTMGEVVAIEAIQNGATDYVLKSGLYRLNPAIKRALHEREEQVERLKLQGAVDKLQIAIEQAPLSIVITDADARIEYVNPKVTEMTGYPVTDLIGRTPGIFKSTATDPKVHKNLWETIANGAVWKGVLCNRKRNGDLYYETAIIAPVKNRDGAITNYIGIKEDISEKRALEAQLYHAQKMEIIGQLAGGIAHDFNNILTVIAGFGTALRMELADRPEAAALIDQILQAEIRAAELTRSLLTFCRKSELKLTPVSLNQTVEGLQKTLIRIIRDGIAFNLDLAECPLVARADKGQIEQVLINLAVNARDAMPHGGTLLFATREVTITGDEAVGNGTLPPGRYAQITVTDSGSGMDKKTMEYIFDPFFTTKEAGKGTGLGLAIVHGIIKNHGGKVSVQSEPGKGTTFTIHLPLLEEAEMDGASATA